MNASATPDVPESTRTGDRSAPMIPIAAISRDSQRTAISVATAPTRPATSSPTAGSTRWYSVVAAVVDAYSAPIAAATSASEA